MLINNLFCLHVIGITEIAPWIPHLRCRTNTIVSKGFTVTLRPITTGAGSAMNQSQFLAITCNSLEAREKSRVHGAIGFGFDSHWLKNWRESFKPITKRSNRNHVITFDSHLNATKDNFSRARLVQFGEGKLLAQQGRTYISWHSCFLRRNKGIPLIKVYISN